MTFRAHVLERVDVTVRCDAVAIREKKLAMGGHLVVPWSRVFSHFAELKRHFFYTNFKSAAYFFRSTDNLIV